MTHRTAFVLLWVLALFGGPTLAAASKPNFLVILADNLGKDWFGCYGADGGHTPQIDRLAADGVRFKHCYVTPLCSTTRVQFLTGRYGFRTGWVRHHDAAIYGGGGFDWKRETTWARALRDAGYATCVTGKWQINDLYDEKDALKQHGFDEHLVWTGALVGTGVAEERWKASIAPGGNRELESRYWDPVVFRNGERMEMKGRFGPEVYLGYLVEFMARHRGSQPFVAYYACPFTHIPTVPTRLVPDKNAEEREQFAGMVRSMDAQVGQLVKELERLSLRDNTVILYMTDNGSSRRLPGSFGGKPAVGGLGTLSENGLDEPLIVNCPARGIPEGRVSEALVDCSDVFPTLLELAGVQVPAGLKLDGRSFAAELGGNRAGWQPREWVFAQNGEVRVLRDERFKWYSTGQLFNVEADVLEKNDLSGSADREVVAAKQRLQTVLAGLPPDADIGFEIRSSSAFNAKKGKAEKK
jgi:arylsulfatase A-like enzyme